MLISPLSMLSLRFMVDPVRGRATLSLIKFGSYGHILPRMTWCPWSSWTLCLNGLNLLSHQLRLTVTQDLAKFAQTLEAPGFAVEPLPTLLCEMDDPLPEPGIKPHSLHSSWSFGAICHPNSFGLSLRLDLRLSMLNLGFWLLPLRWNCSDASEHLKREMQCWRRCKKKPKEQ